MINLTVECLERYSSRVQQLASRGWHQVDRQEEMLTAGGRPGGRSATGDRGQAAGSLLPDAAGTRLRAFESSQLQGSYVGDLL